MRTGTTVQAVGDDLIDLKRHFAHTAQIFVTSPLYQRLCPAVAEAPETLRLLQHRRAGQQPSFLLFAAVHYLLLSGADHPLRTYYPSMTASCLSPDGAPAAFLDFCQEQQDPLRAVIADRLVQTNVVPRATALGLALHEVRHHTADPVHLVDVGSSAGLHLLFDRFRFELGDRVFGQADSSVRLQCEWRSPTPPPDLDFRPHIASRQGVDLHPVDAADPEDRLWLRALVWPEDQDKAAVLHAALDLARQDPPLVHRLDVSQGLGALADTLPDGEPRVVFHAAVRMHVPPDDRPAFDAAIDALGERGPLFHAWLEPPDAPHRGYRPTAGALELHGPSGASTTVARVDGHVAWASPPERGGFLGQRVPRHAP